LGYSAAEAEEENDTTQHTEEQINNDGKHWWFIIKQLMEKSVRKRTLLGCFLMAAQQV